MTSSKITRAVLGLIVSVALTTGSAAGAQATSSSSRTSSSSHSLAASPPWTPTVRYLIGQLTVDEKISLVHGSLGEGITNPTTPTDPGANGAIGVVAGVPRLGIPTFRHVDSNGVNLFADSTAYPGRLGVAAAFDRSAVSAFGKAVGREGRALGADLIYAPQADLTRLPTWARNLTTYGEDPYLTSQLATADVRGIQSSGLLAQLKHFAFYNGQDQDTPSIVDERAAHELYLKAYEAALTDGRASSVMCSYAKYQVAGVQQTPAYACENAFGLQDVLRRQFGFTGWVGSDYGASHATSDLLGGLDQEFLSNNLAPAALKPLVDPSSPTFDPAYAKALDGAVARILFQYQRFGRLDDSRYPAWAKTHVRPAPAPGAFDEQAGIALARRLAEESAVLLKNDRRVLPLSRAAGSSVAVIGPTAAVLPAAPGTERSRGVGQRTTISPLDMLREQAGDARVSYAPGIDRVGATIPASAFSTTPGGPPGLTRTTTAPDGTIVGTQVDARLAGNQTDLVKGNTYTWTGYVNIPAADTWTLWLQRPAGTLVGNPSGPNGGVNPGYQAGPFTGVFDSASLTVDGTARPLTSVSTLHPNDYKGGPTLNGQYLGLTTVGAAVTLTPGEHQITVTYGTSAKAATTPTMRLSWAPQQSDVDAAVAAAARARTAVVFVDDANTTTAAGDVGPLGPGQDSLIEKVAAANPNTVVVLNTGAGVLMPWLSRVKGVLEMWFPGQEGGTATANLLLGKANPSGRLPITFPTDNAATPFAGHPERTTGVNGQIVWSEALQMGYRWYLANHVRPLFPFGFGLSYSSFAYSDIHVKGPHGRHGRVEVSFRISNTGKVVATEVPQLYLTLPATAGEPSRRLVGFDRVSLDPGHSRTVRLVIDPASTERPLSFWDSTTHAWQTPSGRYGVAVGRSASDIRLAGSFRLR
jgi:beta-glucosidase